MSVSPVSTIVGRSFTYADVLRPSPRAAALVYDIALVLIGSVAIALSAQLALRIPISPVPITGQTFAVLLVGALFGSKRGVATVLAYLAQGAAGLPVFAQGAAGAPYMLGPTGGYLIGFVLAAFIVGRLAERGFDRRFITTTIAMTVATMAIFVPGVLWLGRLVGPEQALMTGIVPYLPGAAVKILLAAILLPQGWRVLRWLNAERFTRPIRSTLRPVRREAGGD